MDEALQKALDTISETIRLNHEVTQRNHEETKLNHLDIVQKLDKAGSDVIFLQQQIGSLQRKFDVVSVENVEIKTELKSLKRELNNVRQESLSSNLIIQGVPEVESTVIELKDLVNQVLVQIEESLESDHVIVDLMRFGRRTEGKTRPIMVKFSSRIVRNQLIQQKKAREVRISASSIQFNGAPATQGTELIYIDEHLTKENADIFAAARKLKSKGVQFIWVKDGAIRGRLQSETAAVRFNCVDDVTKFEAVICKLAENERKRQRSSPEQAADSIMDTSGGGQEDDEQEAENIAPNKVTTRRNQPRKQANSHKSHKKKKH